MNLHPPAPPCAPPARPAPGRAPSRVRVALLVAASLLPTPAASQLGELFKQILPPGVRASDAAPAAEPAAPAGPASPAAALPKGAKPGTASVVAGDAPPVGPKKDVRAELAPDVDCSRPQERFDVVGKLTEYGGTEATLRLQRLVESDYKLADMKPQDREMLQYLAATTVWVPAEVESRLGSIYQRLSSSDSEGANPLQQSSIATIEQRLGTLKAQVRDFPADITLSLNKKLPDGAFARFGGVIELSERFVDALPDTPEGSDFLLAHELSHIYKRHPVKDLQFKLLATEEGWEIGRKLLARALRGGAFDPIRDGLFAVTTVPQLIAFVRTLQLSFGRQQELEADACSVVWLKAIGRDPSRAFAAYRATLGAADGSGAAGAYGPSHPTTEERVARLEGKVRGKPGAKPAPGAGRPTARPARPAKQTAPR